MNEENKNNETDTESIGYKFGTFIGYIITACIVSLIVAVTIRLGSWILGF